MSSDRDGGLRNTLYRTTTRSSRRMTPARRLLYRLAAPLGIALIRAWWRIARVVRVEGEAHLLEALARDGQIDPSVPVAAARQYRIYDVQAAPAQTSDSGPGA